MKRALLLLAFFMLPLFSQIAVLGVPKNATALTYTKVIERLKKEKAPFRLYPIDFTDSPSAIKKIIEENVNILFVTGDYLAKTLQQIKPEKTPIVFLGIKDLHKKMMQGMQESTVGVYRSVDTAKIMKLNVNILKHNPKPALLYKNHTPLSQLIPKFQKGAKKAGIDLSPLPYTSPKEFDTLFKSAKERGVTSLILFPPSAEAKDFQKLIEAQMKYRLPVITQMKSHVKLGALGGATIHYEKIIPRLTKLIISLLNGKKISELKTTYVLPKYVINLSTASTLNLEMNENVLVGAEIIGLYKKLPAKQEQKKALNGNYTIAVSAYSPNLRIQRYAKELEKHGLIEGKNLSFLYFDHHKPLISSKANLIFATGNTFMKIQSLNKEIPIVTLTKTHDIQKLSSNHLRNYTGAIRINVNKIMHLLKELGHKRIAYVTNESLNAGNIPEIINNAALRFGIHYTHYLYTKETLDDVFKQIKKEGNTLIMTFPPTIRKEDIPLLINRQSTYRIPLFVQTSEELNSGAAFGLYEKIDQIFEYMANVTVKILQGRKASEFPLFFPSSELIINLNTVNTLSVHVAEHLLKQSKIVISKE